MNGLTETELKQKFKNNLTPVANGVFQVTINNIKKSGYKEELFEMYKQQFVEKNGQYFVLINGQRQFEGHLIHG